MSGLKDVEKIVFEELFVTKSQWVTFGDKFRTRTLTVEEKNEAKARLGEQFDLFIKLYLPTTPDDERLQTRNELAKKNKLLVMSVVRRYFYSSQFTNSSAISQIDLEQAGNTGLLRALEDFNPGSGYKFSSYAFNWIKSYIKRDIINNGPTIRIPVHVSEKLSRLGSVERECYRKLQRKPTNEEIAEKLNISLDNLEELRRNSQKIFSLDTPNTNGKRSDEDGFFSLMDSIPAKEKTPVFNVSGDKIFDVFKEAGLKEDEIFILKYRFGLGGVDFETLEVVGKKINLCRERVRQIEAKALRKLRNPKYSSELEKFR